MKRINKIMSVALALSMMATVAAGTVVTGAEYDAPAIAEADAAAQDFEIDSAGVLTKYKGTDEDVVIPSSVASKTITAIGDSAFSGNKTMKSVSIPETVTSLGSYCFRDCTLLESIEIPANVKSLGYKAFTGCTALESVTLNEGLESIGAYAFSIARMYENIPTSPVTSSACTALKKIVIPSTVTSIGDHAFSGCSALTSAEVRSAEDVVLSAYAFEECGALETVSLSSHVTALGDKAFFRCASLKKLDVPASVESIGYMTFSGCTSLEEIDLKKGLKSIGNAAFGLAHMYENILTSPITTQGCISLKEIVIPSTVTSLGEFLFDGCNGLKLAVVQSHSSDDTVITLRGYTFAGCTSLEYLVLSDSIMSFEGTTFNDCKAVKGIYYQGSESDWEKIKNIAAAPAGVKMYYNQKTTVAVSSIDVVTLPEKTKYEIGDSLALKGATFNATYSNGMVINFNVEKSMVTGFDSTVPGICTVTVKFHDVTGTFNVTIKGLEVVGIAVTTPPTKTEYAIGEELDVTGGVVTVTYDDTSKKEIPLTLDMCSGFDSTTAGTKTVTVTYEGKTATFKVTVKKGTAPTPPVPSDSIVATFGGTTVTFADLTTLAKEKTFKNATGDVEIIINADLTTPQVFTLPSKATSVTLTAPEAHTVTLKATSLSAKGDLTLENITLKTAKGTAAAVTAKKSLTVTGCTLGAVKASAALTVTDSTFDALTASGKAGTATTLGGTIVIAKALTVSNDLVVSDGADITVNGKFTPKGTISFGAINAFTVKNGK